ncbi:MAG: MFS transporter, partial [Erysipelotrichaceae bacterium]|nr:MFS transporter [Erysipelotrichaceae bacterium]
LGLDTVGQVIFLLLTQVVAWIGSLVFAKLSKKYDTVPLIQICILGYTAVCLYALTLQHLWQFAVMAFGVGCFQGSIQSLSRSYFSRIIPDENSGEYFGIYDIFAKGASFLGSFVIYLVKKIGIRTNGVFNIFGFTIKSINVAVGCLALFFILGLIFIRMADKQEQSEASKKDIQ